MAIAKWIGGFLGFITTGSILGALAGYALGALFDGGLEALSGPDTNNYNNREYDDGDAYRRYQEYRQRQTYEGQRNSFLFSLLVLAAYVIRADGKVMHSEMNVLRNFLRQNFGEQSVSQGEDIVKKLFERQKQEGTSYRSTIRNACQQIAMNMEYSQRLQLVSFLVMIAQADGNVVQAEIQALRDVAANLGISAADVESMLNLRSSKDDLEAAYKVLGISPSATDEEVKAAYRQMALKHHPDKVATLGDDVRKAAEKKFQEINDAKDKIYKARGL
ncbi:MAG: TerB family tellurite resistance protein [Prevotella sp.]|nr:TerB family tellurite resistance protein [Prevotella sp.]